MVLDSWKLEHRRLEVATLADRINISRFSKIGFLLNTTARILKLYKRYKGVDGIQKEIKMAELTVSDVEAAERFWILEAQTLSNKAVKEGKLVKFSYVRATRTVLLSLAVEPGVGCRLRGTGIEITSWLVSAYDFYSRVGEGSLNERVSAANE